MYFHPSLGASILINDQLTVQSSSYEAVCSGQEENVALCPQVDSMISGSRNLCETGSVFVKCFITDEKAELDCQPPETDLPTALPTTTTATVSRTTVVTITAAGSSPPLTDTEPGMTSTATQPTNIGMTDSSSFLTAPTLYYFIGGLSAIIIAIILLAVVFLLTCCCCCKRRKDVSPTDAGQREKGNRQLQSVDYATESKAKDHSAAHHQLQQSSQPIYEAITSNENSSTHSQESPSLKPLMPATTPAATDMYASLDQNNTYAQIEPHISSPRSASISSPNADSYYQQLNHRTGSGTGSMKRELPSRPVGAMNPTALAMVCGEVEERDLSTQGEVLVGGSSTSLPANTGHSPQMPNGRSHLEDIKLRELQENGNESGDKNIYHVLDPPPDYNTLEQIDEISQVSTTAVCNNGTARGGGLGTRSKEHSPHVSHHSQERFPIDRSTTLPGSTGHSPRSSRTSSLSSNSPHTNRSSRSPQVVRLGSGGPASRKVSANKYSDDPTALISGSPRISNRHSGQSAGSDSMVDTLV